MSPERVAAGLLAGDEGVGLPHLGPQVLEAYGRLVHRNAVQLAQLQHHARRGHRLDHRPAQAAYL